MKFDLSDTLRATPAQVDYILRLCAEIQEEGAIPPVDPDELDFDSLTRDEASAIIDDLKSFLGWV
jgi:hypothetical protein